ncbi:MAG: FKBP-type peptidyl-prolyl cis-trans isomerase [Prevotellaceae bacterium]|jgi:FKBP-type peptidyl-prolyl cis-trans isomerase FklB|nr:FKBP-type peptidyl-prolyl cis-trans isomerase [Prevotellaceae bacterium]
MKKSTLIVMAIAVAIGLASCTAQAPKADLKSDIDTLSYAIAMSRTSTLTQYLGQVGVTTEQYADAMRGIKEGMKMTSGADKAYLIGLGIGQNIAISWVEQLQQQIYGNDSVNHINANNIFAGFFAGVDNDSTIMTVAAASTYEQENMQRITDKMLAARFAENKEAGEKFLAENKTKEGVVTTPSGLQYKIITAGKGAIPVATDRVSVNYKGTLIDGTEFDSSYKNNKPAIFRADQVIPGWTEALTMMPVGSKWELYIPQDLAYGSREASTQIKPFSTLIFEVELVGIEK